MIAGIALDGVVGDLAYLLLTGAFFGVAVLLLAACRRIAGEAGTTDPVRTASPDGAGDNGGRSAAAATAGTAAVSA